MPTARCSSSRESAPLRASLHFPLFSLCFTLLIAVGSLALTACSAERGDRAERQHLVFAAASLRDVFDELADHFERQTGITPVFNFAGSNVLALQIEASPSADVFVSANERWMDYVEDAELIVPGSRRALLSNRLVVIAHRTSTLALSHPSELAEAGFRFLSLADPQAVPAGLYARHFLENVPVDGGDLWTSVRDRVAPAPDVRAALGMVEAQPDTLGIVYRTDARAAEKLRVLLEVPEQLAFPIRYSAATIRGPRSRQPAERFLDFLASRAAAAVFEAHGFIVLDAKGSDDG